MPKHKSGPQSNVYSILLAGGAGTRLWPVSRELYPKQLVNLIGKDSLIQTAIKRLAPVLAPERIRIVCGEKHIDEIARQMEEIGITPEGKIICEPCGRNTAPAILLAVLKVLKNGQDALFCIFPADHVISDIESFCQKVESAVRLADKGYIVTFGIRPDYPETGYGYIKGSGQIKPGEVFDEALSIKRFAEKPDYTTAKKYIEAGNFFWNSGMFAFKGSVIIDEFKVHQPELFNRMDTMISENRPITKQDYQLLPGISIDYAIMEKTDKGVVLPSDFGWSDIGSWKALYDFLEKDEKNNVIQGDVIAQDTKNSFIWGHERLIATNHLNHMVVVETPDSVFVSDMDTSRDVKSIVTLLKEKRRREYHQYWTSRYSWGSRTTLEEKKGYKVDRLTIHSGSMLQIKAESSTVKHLIVVKGEARMTPDNQDLAIKTGEPIIITEKDSVMVENPGPEPLALIQVETGIPRQL